MALFGSYAPPGVYSSVVISGGGQPLFNSARVPVIIGEGQEFFIQSNVELHRGSSSVADEQAVNENISDQVTTIKNQFQTTYFPVVTGTGKGQVTDDPSFVQVVADGIPVTVIALDGETGAFTTQELLLPGQNVDITYFFKRTDTQIVNEDDSNQVPVFGTLLITDSTGGTLTIGTTIPGAIDNAISVELFDDTLSSPPGTGVVDALAVGGAGTDAITIDIRKVGGGIRTITDLYNLVQAGIPTLDAGYLTATFPVNGSPTGVLTVQSPPVAHHLTGGAGPNSNTTFKVQHVPIVDGTNGGVVTTDVTKVTAKVNGAAVPVSAVNGAAGLVTLASPVAAGSTLTFSYFTNTYQNTFDLLPASNVASVTEVGLGPDRSDFIQDTDFSLGTDANGNGTIIWGAADIVTSGVNTTGFTPFGPTQITTTLVDDIVYLRPVTGVANGKNLNFTLQDVPVDGSGRAVATDNPNLIFVYVGLDAAQALANGAVRVIALSGATGAFTLYQAPAAGQKVFATYYRNTLNDHTYTVQVVNPGIPGQGTYTLTDEAGRVLPLAYVSATSVADGNFNSTGIVFPSAFSDLFAEPGAVDEVVTLSFASDSNQTTVNNATQAMLTTQGITFTAQTPGSGGNAIQIAFDTTTQGNPTVAGNVITIHGSLTISQVVGLFPVYVAAAGTFVIASGSGSTLVSTSAAQHLLNGTNGVNVAIANKFTVSSSAGSLGSSGTGYLGQTYIDALTALRFTIVAPQEALNYGYTTLPSPQYVYAPGDTLTLTVSKGTPRYSGSVYYPFSTAQPNNLIAIQGLRTKVATTFGANSGDTAIIQTFNKSGNEPAIGEFYYVTFTVNKTTADMAIKIYTNAADAFAAYGQPSTVNRVSLGVQFMTQNGAQQFGVIQVPKQAGLNIASDGSFISAIQTLTTALPGSNFKASVICPLSTSTTVHQFLSRQLITQATARYKGEAIGFVGYSTTTDSSTARANARALANARMIAIGMPAAGVLLTNSQTGVAIEYAVDGSFMAAAMAGLEVNPSNDVATTLTEQDLTGFSRLLVQYDDATMNLMAADGLVCLLNNNGALQIRHYKSTDPSNPITSEPTSTTVTDYVRQQFRADLKQFIGRKLVDGLVTDIQVVSFARLNSLLNNQIISGYKNLSVIQDPTDPTTVDVTVTFKPMFSLLYISVTFTVTTSL